MAGGADVRWSRDGQSPAFLAATRMISLAGPIVDDILAVVRIEPGMRVLDVGCGSGELCFRLGSRLDGVRFTGIDLDEDFVAFAARRASGGVGYPFEEPNPDNEYAFMAGDGLDLPFGDDEFDVVVAHTYLTAVPDWAAALAEMRRVCKPGGTVASITAMTGDFVGMGSVSLFGGCLLDPADAALLRRVSAARAKLMPAMELTAGIAPRKVPVALEWMGLEHVRCQPLAHYFCPSDAAADPAECRRYIDLLHLEETAELDALEHARELTTTAGANVTSEEIARCRELVDRRRDQLLDAIGNDREWNWVANTMLLAVGEVPDGSGNDRCHAMREETRAARALRARCEEARGPLDVRMAQLGAGRCVRLEATLESGEREVVFGFDPQGALAECCERLLEDGSTPDEPAADPALPLLPPESVYAIDQLWETVSEAALVGISLEFRGVRADDGSHLVACTAATGDARAARAAAHPVLATSVRRALARALGALGASGVCDACGEASA